MFFPSFVKNTEHHFCAFVLAGELSNQATHTWTMSTQKFLGTFQKQSFSGQRI